jgi:hypothetical protein
MADNANTNDPWASVMADPGSITPPKRSETSGSAPVSDKNDPWSSVMAEPGSYKAPTSGAPTQPMGNIVNIPMGTEEKPTPWSEVGKGFVANVVPSTGRAIVGAAEGLGHAVMHPIDTAQGIGHLAKGLYSKEEGWRGAKQDPEQKAQDEALVNAFMQSYSDKYGSWEGFKHTLANDPASIGMDLATVASGGELAAGKLAGLAGTATTTGKVLGTAADVAGNVAKYTNPLTPATTAVGAVASKVGAPIIGKVFKTAGQPGTEPIWDASAGTFTQPVQDLIKTHFEGRLDPAVLHDIKDSISHEMSEGGINSASLDQALLKAQGMAPTTSGVTGIKAPAEAKAGLEEVRVKNMLQAQQNAESLIGGPIPNTPVMGDALEQAMEARKNNYAQAYDALNANTDRLHPSVFNGLVPDLHAAVEARLGTSLDPSKFAGYSGKRGLSSNQTAFPGTQEAIDILKNDLAPIPTAVPMQAPQQGMQMLPKVTALGPITQKTINDVRKSLNKIWDNASDMDRRGIDAVKQVLDDRIDGAYSSVTSPRSTNPLVFDAKGRPLSPSQAAQTRNLIGDANSKYADYRNTFTNYSTTPDGVIARAAKNLNNSLKYDPQSQAWVGQATPEMHNIAQSTLLQGLKDPAKSAAIYDKLAGPQGVFASSPQHIDMLDQMLRRSILNGDAEKLPANIDKFLKTNKALADRIFPVTSAGVNPQNELRQLGEAIRSANKIPDTNPAKPGILRDLTGRLGKAGIIAMGHGVGGGMGAITAGIISHNLHMPPPTPEAALARQLQGNPKLPASAYAPEVPPALSDAANAAALASGEYEENVPRYLTIHRKAGGRVSKTTPEQRAEKLIRMADLAKKQVNKTTETLLSAPDEAVVKALKIAQAHI